MFMKPIDVQRTPGTSSRLPQQRLQSARPGRRPGRTTVLWGAPWLSQNGAVFGEIAVTRGHV